MPCLEKMESFTGEGSRRALCLILFDPQGDFEALEVAVGAAPPGVWSGRRSVERARGRRGRWAQPRCARRFPSPCVRCLFAWTHQL